MDPEGYLPVTLIASFHRVQALTDNMSIIIDAICSSDKLELSSGFKVRPNEDPNRWPILDTNNEEKEELISKLVPPPPLPKTLRDRNLDNLNPDVAEFVPNDLDLKNMNNKNLTNGENNKNGEETNWRQVKRKNKDNKGKKELKVKYFEREELDFPFDEELDQEMPTGRQNTFSSEW